MQPFIINSDHPLNNLLLQHHVNNLTNGVASPGSDSDHAPSPGNQFVLSTPITSPGIFVPMSQGIIPSPMMSASGSPVKVSQIVTQRIRGSFAGLFARKAGR